MMQTSVTNRLDRPVDNDRDHVLGPADAGITLVEYGSYACPHCRAANQRIAEVRSELGDRMRYTFRQRPLVNNELARRAAELVECAQTPEQFWQAHMTLMSRSSSLNEEDLLAVAEDLGLQHREPASVEEIAARARQRVDEDENSAQVSGVRVTPTFFINEKRYDGPWDESAFTDALLGSLGHRVRTAALEFASWAPSAGILLLLATVLAVAVTNSPFGNAFNAFWERPFGFVLGDASFLMSLRHWVNDGLLTLFFLVVGLEIKREFTVGHLATRRSAAFPIAAAAGGMIVPAGLYVLVIGTGNAWSQGWGVPMATDTAFAIALIAILGERVPVELRIFLTAAAIVDDIGAILVIAAFYSTDIQVSYLLMALAVTGGLALLNNVHVYRAAPYLLLGILLWVCVHAGGLHATLAGVLLAVFIPTRPPPDYQTLAMQADTILAHEAQHSSEVLRTGPSEPALRALDAIHDRLESPADRMLRHAGPRASYLVLPLFALANGGVLISMEVFEGRASLVTGIIAGLLIGKPLGMTLAAYIAVRLGVAAKPAAYSWLQIAGAGALAGIGFTMSLFIAGQAFTSEADFASAKIAVFLASILAALAGTILLWVGAQPPENDNPGNTAGDST